MENFSVIQGKRKAGRPRRDTFHGTMFCEGTDVCRRTVINKEFSARAIACLKGEDGKVEERFAFLDIRVPGNKLRWTILAALGRFFPDDKDGNRPIEELEEAYEIIRYLASQICEGRMNCQTALAYIARVRRAIKAAQGGVTM